jgi:hypothetical protein
MLTKYFEEEMGDIIEAEKKISHIKLAERVEAKLDDQKFLKAQKLGADVPSRSPVPLTSSLIPINWNGPIRPSFKVVVSTTFVHQLYPTTIISTAV